MDLRTRSPAEVARPGSWQLTRRANCRSVITHRLLRPTGQRPAAADGGDPDGEPRSCVARPTRTSSRRRRRRRRAGICRARACCVVEWRWGVVVHSSYHLAPVADCGPAPARGARRRSELDAWTDLSMTLGCGCGGWMKLPKPKRACTSEGRARSAACPVVPCYSRRWIVLLGEMMRSLSRSNCIVHGNGIPPDELASIRHHNGLRLSNAELLRRRPAGHGTGEGSDPAAPGGARQRRYSGVPAYQGNPERNLTILGPCAIHAQIRPCSLELISHVSLSHTTNQTGLSVAETIRQIASKSSTQ
jgi:hypothetical protein